MPDERDGRRVPAEPDEHRADRFAIGHDVFQFRFDFWLGPEGDEPLVTRIVTTPIVARDFSRRLRESLKAHERRARRFGSDTK